MFKEVLTPNIVAAMIGDDIDSGRSGGASLRVVRQFIRDARRAPVVALAHVDTPFESTGSPRWDALVSAAVDMVLTELQRPLPDWLLDPEPLEEWWFFNGIPELNVRSMVQSPPQFAMRGVFVQRAALENL